MSAKIPVHLELRFQGKEKLLLVDDADFVVGRSSKLKVSIESNNISREHLRVQHLNGKFWITDLSSTNGTFLNGKRLQAQVSTEYRGEELCIGPIGEGVYIRMKLDGEPSRVMSAPQQPARTAPPMPAGLTRNSTSSASSQHQQAPSRNQAPTQSQSSTRTGISVALDSGFLVNPLGNQKNGGAQSDVIQQGSSVQQYDAYNIEMASRKKELVEVERRRVHAERQIAEINQAREAAEALIRHADEKRRDLQRIEQQANIYELKVREAEQRLQDLERDSQVRLVRLEREAQARIAGIEAEENRQREIIAHTLRQVEEVQRRREAVEADYRSDEDRIFQMREQLKVRESEQHRRSYELQSQMEKLTAETEFLKKRLMLESETIQAEAQLRKTQIEKDIQELQTKKITEEREYETLIVRAEQLRANLDAQTQEAQRLEGANRAGATELAELNNIITNTQERKRLLEAETYVLSERIRAANDECQRILSYARTNADESLRRANEESQRLIDDGIRRVNDARGKSEEDVRAFREKAEAELREREQKLLAEIGEDRKDAEEKIRNLRMEWEREEAALREKAKVEHDKALETIASARAEWNRESESLRANAQQEHERAMNAWKSEMDSTRSKDLEALGFWRAEQEKKVQEKLSGDIDGLIHAVATATLSKLQRHGAQMISQNELMNTLEPQLKEALLSEASLHGPFNPNREQATKTFWRQFGRKAVAGVAILAAVITVPQIVAERFEQAKANRSTSSSSSDAFVQRLKEARKKATDLNLEMRSEFQTSYADNVMYNDGYLEIKQDPDVQKEWVIKLYQFFFEVLQMPDRVVVDFIPMESSIIRSLAETRKTMNTRNFKGNLEQMKAAERKKLEQEVFPLLGNSYGNAVEGKKNWQKIRELEREFYQEKLKQLSERNEHRDLASDPGAPSS